MNRMPLLPFAKSVHINYCHLDIDTHRKTQIYTLFTFRKQPINVKMFLFGWYSKHSFPRKSVSSHWNSTEKRTEKSIQFWRFKRESERESERKKKRAGIYSNITSLLAISIANKEFRLKERSFFICSSSHFTNHENEPWTRHFLCIGIYLLIHDSHLTFVPFYKKKKVARKNTYECVCVCVSLFQVIIFLTFAWLNNVNVFMTGVVAHSNSFSFFFCIHQINYNNKLMFIYVCEM